MTLNAMAQGIPIVSTTLGYEGIAVALGEDILRGDTPEEFAAAVLHLLEDANLAACLTANGRRLAEEKYGYRRACTLLNEVYARVEVRT